MLTKSFIEKVSNKDTAEKFGKFIREQNFHGVEIDRLIRRLENHKDKEVQDIAQQLNDEIDWKDMFRQKEDNLLYEIIKNKGI